MLEQSQKLSWLKDEVEFKLQKVISKEKIQETSLKKRNISKQEEKDLLSRFNELVLLSSKKNQINPTLFFSKKNQKEFLLEVLNTNTENALSQISPWKKELISSELCSLFSNI